MVNGDLNLMDMHRLQMQTAIMALPYVVRITSMLEGYSVEERRERADAVKLGIDHSYPVEREPDYTGPYAEFYKIGRKIGDRCIKADRAESRN